MRAVLLAGLAAALAGSAARAVPTRFLVAERPGQVVHGDSYVLVLEADSDIADARALILDPDAKSGSIVSAQIAPGADGVNRDFRAPGAPPWSWHLTRFDGFSDIAIELCDGWPSFVEADVARLDREHERRDLLLELHRGGGASRARRGAAPRGRRRGSRGGRAAPAQGPSGRYAPCVRRLKRIALGLLVLLALQAGGATLAAGAPCCPAMAEEAAKGAGAPVPVPRCARLLRERRRRDLCPRSPCRRSTR